MRWRSEAALRELIEVRTQELFSEMMKLGSGAFEPSEQMFSAMMELDDLESELEFVRDNGPGFGESDAVVCVPLNPVPGLNSGAIALPEADEPQH